MRNQPRYHFFRNTRYALHGFLDIVHSEKSFRIELVIFILLQFSLLFISLSFYEKLFLSLILFLPLIIEAINSAIERVVDLVTLEQHQMAKKAKDAGSAAVFLSLICVGMAWLFVLTHHFLG